MLSVIGVLLAAVAAGAIAGEWTPRELQGGSECIGWLSLSCAIWAEGHLLRAVLPRVEHDREYEELRYFGHVVQVQDRAEFDRLLERADGEIHQLADQVWVLSRIVDAKYRHVRRGLLFFVAAVALALSALAANELCG